MKRQTVIGILGIVVVFVVVIAFARSRGETPAGYHPAESVGGVSASGAAANGAATNGAGGKSLVALDPPLYAAELDYNFGTVSMANGKVTHGYAIRNTTKAPVTISKVYTSCMCTQALLKTSGGEFGPFGMPGHAAVPSISAVVAPGETVTVDAVFDPAAHGPAGVGPISRVVYVESDAGAPLEFKFSAVVSP